MDLCPHRKRKWLLRSLSLTGGARALYRSGGKVCSSVLWAKDPAPSPFTRGPHPAPRKEAPLDRFDPRAAPRGGVRTKPRPLLWSWERQPRVPWPLSISHPRWVPGLQVRRPFCRSPEAPGPLLCRGQCCPLPAAGGSERWRSAEQLAILQFPLVTKLHMFRKLNLCQRLVVPSQKIQSDLYIALHKFLVNLYNHLERESLLISQRTTAMATSVTETAGLYEAVPGISSRAGGGGQRKKNTSAGSPASPHHRSHPTQPRVEGSRAPSKTHGSAFPRGKGLLLFISFHSTNPLPSVALFKNRQPLNARLPSLRRQPRA